MPAEVETMMYVREEPWHHLGVKLDNPATAKEAIVASGLDWKVEMCDVYAAAVRDVGGSLKNVPLQAPDNQAVVRELDDSVLGIVGKNYVPIQNEESFDLMDSVVGAGQAIYHTAGSLRGGRRVWMLIQLPGDLLITEKEIINRYLLLTNAHDGSSTLKMFFTPVRVVCMNTLTWALHQRKEGEGINIRHCGDIESKVDEAKAALGFATRYYSELELASRKLIETRADQAMVDKLLESCFPRAMAEDATEREQSVLAQLDWIASGNTGTVTPGTEGSLYAWVNAVAEYVDHNRHSRGTDETIKRSNRMDSIVFGGGRDKKQRAFTAAMAMVS